MKLTCLFTTICFFSNILYGQYRIPASVFGSGGNTISNSSFRMLATTGQTVAGFTQGGNFRMSTGWPPPAQLLTPVEQITNSIPFEYRLDQNYPNPFNPSTTIRFDLPYRSSVVLHIYNALGQLMATLVNEGKEPGRYEVMWDGRNAQGAHLGSGVYFYRLVAAHNNRSFVETKKLTLLR